MADVVKAVLPPGVVQLAGDHAENRKHFHGV